MIHPQKLTLTKWQNWAKTIFPLNLAQHLCRNPDSGTWPSDLSKLFDLPSTNSLALSYFPNYLATQYVWLNLSYPMNAQHAQQCHSQIPCSSYRVPQWYHSISLVHEFMATSWSQASILISRWKIQSWHCDNSWNVGELAAIAYLNDMAPKRSKIS